jgi:hypothetical protein
MKESENKTSLDKVKLQLNSSKTKTNEQENTIGMLMDQIKKKDLDIDALRKEINISTSQANKTGMQSTNESKKKDTGKSETHSVPQGK